jgi:Ca2+-binding RTX toxin-like protein
MANVSFVNLDQTFDLSLDLLTFPGVSVRTSTTFTWASLSSAGNPSNGVLLVGTGFTYDGAGAPTGGVAHPFSLNLNNDADNEVVITGLAIPLVALLPAINGGLTDGEKNNFIWRTVLAGNDTVTFSSGSAARFAGDGRDVSAGVTVFGGADTITGNVSATGTLMGDIDRINAGGSVYGGNDTIRAAASQVSGDAATVDGFLAGGNDVLAVQPGGGVGQFFGDAISVWASATLVGGHDRITLSNGANAFGEAFSVQGDLVGGNDTITGSAAGDFICGDVSSVFSGGTMRGGNDILRGGGGNDNIFGDWEAPADPGPAVRGGNDSLFGDGGKDTIDGNGGKDTIRGGLGADMLTGGSSADRFVFDTKLGPSNVDKITDFSPGTDKIALDDKIFRALGSSVAASEFGAKASGHAAGNNQHIIYDKSNGSLWYDADDNGPGAAIRFATLVNKPASLDAGDFTIV